MLRKKLTRVRQHKIFHTPPTFSHCSQSGTTTVSTGAHQGTGMFSDKSLCCLCPTSYSKPETGVTQSHVSNHTAWDVRPTLTLGLRTCIEQFTYWNCGRTKHYGLRRVPLKRGRMYACCILEFKRAVAWREKRGATMSLWRPCLHTSNVQRISHLN